MHNDGGDAAEYLAKAIFMNFPAKGIRTVNCLQSKHSCGFDEMKTWNMQKLHGLHSHSIRFVISQYKSMFYQHNLNKKGKNSAYEITIFITNCTV